MSLSSKLKLPVDLLGVAGRASSFRDNQILGAPNLNRRGLHVRRIKLAETMADNRRRRLKHLVSKQQADQYADLGYIHVENALPDDLFQHLSQKVETTRFAAREMKQGAAVTRFITLSPGVLQRAPYLKSVINGPLFQGLMRFVGAKNADPLVTLHTVLTDPEMGAPDPQTTYHSDTFHSTSKGWLFLRDVAVEDGPFSYIPGSHRLTPERVEWEYEQSIHAAAHQNHLHARGSFRASERDLSAMGFAPYVQFPVKANTLIVADTHGFHARRPSTRPSTRLALYGSLRAHPFSPLAGPDLFDLPGLRNRKAQMLDWYRAAAARLSGRPESQPYVGDLLPGDPPIR